MRRLAAVFVAFSVIVGGLTTAKVIPALSLAGYLVLFVAAVLLWPVLRLGVLSIPLLGELLSAIEGRATKSEQRS